MRPLWTVLTIACILIPLLYALYYFGFLVTRAGANWFRASISLPTRWEGKMMGTTGFMRRKFVVFKKYTALAIAFETGSGSIQVEVSGPDGAPLSPASGSYGRDGSFLIDVSRFRNCSVALHMDRFTGQFHITLQ